jgi:D-alanyl-D-alanine carboxypeptidase/D-alanyl-D-alanine-endopeptidase (penicillin-binding protein 4)
VPASWGAGIEAVRGELAGLGIDVESLVLVDGSGLSYANRVSPRAFVEALRLAERSFRFGPEFVAALPIAAADGTLEERAEGAAHHVRAKTGSLTRVTGLSGYAEGAGGRRLVFSLLVNGFRGPAPEAWDAVDRFLEELVAGESAAQARRARSERKPRGRAARRSRAKRAPARQASLGRAPARLAQDSPPKS